MAVKVRTVKKIERKLTVHFKELDRIILGNVPINTEDFDEARKILNIDEAKIEKEHAEITGWGLHWVYDTPSGELEAGCMYWADWYPENMNWDNHKGAHLIVVLPNGDHWNIDSRASNCTMKEDRTHRCWCRHGEPPSITVDKKGHTCRAGAGSIMSGNYHGFLRNGILT